MAPSDINRVACPPGRLKSMGNGSADPVATFTQQIKEACSHQDALIGASVEDFGSFAAAFGGHHLPHPPLSPYHMGRLLCVFRGGNVSKSTLMTTSEFWTPSLSNPPHSPLHTQRPSCLFWGGNINCRSPSFCQIVGRITSGQQRTTQQYVVLTGLVAALVAVINHTCPILCTMRLFPPSLNQHWGGLQCQLQHHLPCRHERMTFLTQKCHQHHLLRCHCLLPPSYPSHS